MPESNGFKRLAGGESKLCPFLTDLENEFCVCNSQDLCKLFQEIYIQSGAYRYRKVLQCIIWFRLHY